LQVLARPLFADYEIPAEQIPGGSYEAEDGGEDGSEEFGAGHLSCRKL